MLNYNFIFEKSQKERIDQITIEREYWQLLFLQKIYELPGSQKLYFKGGTAIRFLLNSFRFSEDLDFTSIISKEETEKFMKKIFDFFLKNSPSSIEIKKEKVWEKFGDVSLKYRFLFLPRNSKQKASIRIDISLREKPVTREITVLTPFDYPISPYPLVVHLSAKEMLAEKIRALFIRGKPRDLFDVWFLLTKKVEIDEKIIDRKFKLYPKLKYDFKKTLSIIKNYDEKELKKDLNQFLPENYRNFYKQLKEETLKIITQPRD